MHFPEIAPQLVANGYTRPVPIVAGSKRPPMDAWQQFQYDPTDTTSWATYGTGIITGEVIGVDIDCYDHQVTESLRNLAQRILGPTLIRVGSPPKELLVYRTAELLTKTQTQLYKIPGTPKGSKVEILATGQQFVAFAVHMDTGKPYTWVADESPLNTPLSKLPEVGATKLSIFLQMADEILAAAAGQAPAAPKSAPPKKAADDSRWPIDAGAAALALVDLLPGERDKWRNLAWALRDMCGDESFPAFDKWSSGQPDYTGQEDCFAVWDSDKDKPTGITRATLIKLANEAAKALKKDDPKAKAWTDARAKHLKADHDKRARSALETLQEELVFVADQSQFWCLPRKLWVDDNAIRHLYTPIMPDSPLGGKEDPLRSLRESPTKTVVNAKNYWPGKARVFQMDGLDYLNEYIDPNIIPIEPTAEERETWRWFYERTFGQDADGAIFGPWFLSLLAYRVQQPGEKLYKASLIHSPIAGNGKSTWSLFVPRLLLGQDNVGEPRHSQLEGAFNDFFAGRQVVHLDEIRFGGGRVDATKVMDNLKTPIDSEILTINAKFQRPYSIRNIAWVTATSNRGDALAIDDSERRWGVFELKAPALTMEERGRLFSAWLNTDRGPGTLKQILLERDLTGFDPLADPPETRAKEEMRRSSEPVQIQVIRAGLDGEIRTPIFDKDIVAMSAITDFVNAHAQYDITPASLGRLLKSSSLKFEPSYAFSGGRRQRVRVVRSHAFWRKTSEQEKGRYLDIGEIPHDSEDHPLPDRSGEGTQSPTA